MGNDQRGIVAQAVYMAQIEAAKGECDCKVCQLMRQVNEAMTQTVLAGNPLESLMVPSNPLNPAPSKRSKQP